MKGYLQSIDQTARTVTISGQNYSLADHIKTDYLKEGNCEFTVKEGKISFIKRVFEKKQFETNNKPEESLSIQIFSSMPGVDMQQAYNDFKAEHEVKYTQTHVENGKWFACLFYK